ncbi:MAG: L-serine ammonia-lyase, iron-sulfur-dependent, subunit alpha [Desulfotalea sp.]
MSAPSIFNDVIGPIMRGPSSSHSAAAVRLGWFARYLMNSDISEVLVEADKSGSLPTTYHSQGSEMGVLGGILGFGLSDERLIHYADEIAKSGIYTRFEVGDFGDVHPNTYRITVINKHEEHSIIAISSGGGIVEIIAIDNLPVSYKGDRYLAIIYYDVDKKPNVNILTTVVSNATVSEYENDQNSFFLVESGKPFGKGTIDKLKSLNLQIRIIPPFLPVSMPDNMKVPFSSCNEMLAYNKERDFDIADLAIAYEGQRGGLTPELVVLKMVEIVEVVQKAIKTGLAGTSYKDRILGFQSGKFVQAEEKGTLHDLGVLNKIIAYTTALMEVKSSMGVIVAAPTAGSCGGLPATILGVAESLNCGNEKIAKAFLVAGLIGVFIAGDATFSAEVGGCQAECGAGSGMTAAAITYLQNGSVKQSVDAASMALQNILGMVCDPVANRVEVPCLGKNVLEASNALSVSNMALAGFDAVVSLHEVILTMDKVGKSIPHELRCTGLGGLSITNSSENIIVKLKSN